MDAINGVSHFVPSHDQLVFSSSHHLGCLEQCLILMWSHAWDSNYTHDCWAGRVLGERNSFTGLIDMYTIFNKVIKQRVVSALITFSWIWWAGVLWTSAHVIVRHRLSQTDKKSPWNILIKLHTNRNINTNADRNREDNRQF